MREKLDAAKKKHAESKAKDRTNEVDMVVDNA